jgi:hypothetical protein
MTNATGGGDEGAGKEYMPPGILEEEAIQMTIEGFKLIELS